MSAEVGSTLKPCCRQCVQVVNREELLGALRDVAATLGLALRPYTTTARAPFDSHLAAMVATLSMTFPDWHAVQLLNSSSGHPFMLLRGDSGHTINLFIPDASGGWPLHTLVQARAEAGLWFIACSDYQESMCFISQARTGVLVARHGPLLANAIFLPPSAHGPLRLTWHHVLLLS